MCKPRVGKHGALPAAGTVQSITVESLIFQILLIAMLWTTVSFPAAIKHPSACERHCVFLHPADSSSPTYRCQSLVKENSQGFPALPKAGAACRGRHPQEMLILSLTQTQAPALADTRARSHRRARSVHHVRVSTGQYFHHTQNIYFSKTIANDNGYILLPQYGFNISNTYTPNTVQYCTKRKKKDVPPYCTELYIQSTILHSLIYTPYIYWCRRHETMETVLARTFHPTIKQLLLIKTQNPTHHTSSSPLLQD